MLRTLTAVIVLALGHATLRAEEPQVRLTKGEHTVKATIGNEAFFAYQFDVGRRKPFFLPISAPNGINLLERQLRRPSDQPGATSQVFVVQEHALIEGENAKAARAEFGEILTATTTDHGRVFVAEKGGWIQEADIIPVLTTVTRLINDNPKKGLKTLDADYYDHPHHKGVWNSIDEVNGIKFWNEDGRIVNRSVEVLTPQGNPAVMKIVNDWVDEKDQTVVQETATVSVFANRLIEYAIVFTAGDKPVTFGDTKEGMFGIRVPNSMREIAGKGPVVNSDGVEGSAKCWGKPARWIDYNGPIGSNRFGVAIMDHPGNFRPSRYHVRDYGLFSISPFGESAYTDGAQPATEAVIEPGEALSLRYGLYVHGAQADVQKAYQQFLQIDGRSAVD